MVLRIFFADVTGKMRMRAQYYKLKNIHFVEIFIIGITLRDTYMSDTKIVETRMWASAQRDGCPANIGGALCSMPQSLADVHY